jgi:uncharacterized protein with PIN domain
MLYVEEFDDEKHYYVRTKKGNSLILVTRDEQLAKRIEHAISSVEDDSQIRIKAVRGNRKGP